MPADSSARESFSAASSSPGAASLFARHLEALQAGQPTELESLCARHPEHAERLRAFARALALVEGQVAGAFVLAPPAARTSERSAPPDGSRAVASDREGLARWLGIDFGERYRMGAEVARGGQGAVSCVWDVELGRRLAMKVLSEPLPRASGTEKPVPSHALTRFLEEARVTAQLDHPGIVPVHELGLADGRLFFTMKLVEGEDLRSVFAHVRAGRAGWNQTRALGVLHKACEAVAFAHARGVIHRDLKPANVMVGRFGEVYVMDWGLARVLRTGQASLGIATDAPAPTIQGASTNADESSLRTREGDVIGTPAYMSPEQARGENEGVGPSTDVYALGAMLYELLAGHPPYLGPGEQADVSALLARILDGPPPPVHALARHAPPPLAAIAAKAMARTPERRYRDVSELGDDLRAYLENRVVRAHERGAFAELRRWIGRNRALSAALALAALGLAGIGVSEARGRRVAESHRARAEREHASVLRLSARRELDDLVHLAQTLWPAVASRIPEYEAWLERAELLIEKLPEHEEQLARLRSMAHARPRAELEAEWAAHPRADEWRALGERSESLRRRLAVRGGAPLELPEIDTAALPDDAPALNALAWPWVAPERTVFGREAEGLVLARLAHERSASEVELAEAGDTLAWASFACGLDAEARAASDEALANAPPARRAEFAGYRQRLERELAALADDGARAALEAVEARRTALEDELGGERWLFSTSEARWWHGELGKLVQDLRAFAQDIAARRAPDLGWSIAHRLEFARRIDERARSSPAAAERWADARQALGDPSRAPSYGGLALSPQSGLLPLGPDPHSGLWEFAHLASGAPPERGRDGELQLEEDSALVLVLLPGGTFSMGAQRGNPAAPNFDPAAQASEAPVHAVELGPFFLAKHEMTQAQWERFTGTNPSYYQAARPSPSLSVPPTPLHPVEKVSWEDCERVLWQLGLVLPTEAQWEYGARAGTQTPWWTGAARESLSGAVDLADRAWAAAGAEWSALNRWPEFEDGFAVHCPVSAMRANPFGLHNTLGNVWEWCHDSFDAGFYGRSPRWEPRNTVPEARFQVARGGSFTDGPEVARCAYRLDAPRDYRHYALGLRPARSLEP